MVEKILFPPYYSNPIYCGCQKVETFLSVVSPFFLYRVIIIFIDIFVALVVVVEIVVIVVVVVVVES